MARFTQSITAASWIISGGFALVFADVRNIQLVSESGQ